MAGKKAHDTEGNQQSKRKGQDSTCMFFSETVLCTQHDNVAAYPEPITNLLLAVDGQEYGDTKRHTQVYRKWIHLRGPKGEKIRMQAVIDGGAMRNTICTKKWHTQKHCLALLSPSKTTLCIADNHHIPSEGQWTGIVDVAGMEAMQSFEVFNSRGTFQIILGKPWLSYVQAV